MRNPVEPKSSPPSSTSFVSSCFCFSAAFLKKDWMVPGCLRGESFFGSEDGWMEVCVLEERAWVEVTSPERKPAIPPAVGASLNLLAEMCSRVRGGVHAAWWFPAVLRLLIMAKLSLDILVAS